MIAQCSYAYINCLLKLLAKGKGRRKIRISSCKVLKSKSRATQNPLKEA